MKVHDINTSEMHYNMLEFARFRRFCCCRNFGLLRRCFVHLFVIATTLRCLLLKRVLKCFAESLFPVPYSI